MAQALDIPVIGIPSLEVLSCRNNTGKNTFTIMDARRGKVYAGIYAHDGEIIADPHLLEYENAANFIKNNDLTVISDEKTAEKLYCENFISIDKTNFDFGLALAKLTEKYSRINLPKNISGLT